MAHTLGLRIVQGEFPEGRTLPTESELCVELSVSRTALREAMKALAAKGLVESRPKTGTRVCERRNWNLLDPDILAWLYTAGLNRDHYDALSEVRRIVEPAAARLAARRASEEDLGKIRRAFQGLCDAGEDVEAGIEPDVKFHLSILEAAGNPFLAPLGALIRSALAESFRLSSSLPDAQQRSLQRHGAVLEAIEAGDGAAAEAAMRTLIDHAKDYLAQALREAEPPPPGQAGS